VGDGEIQPSGCKESLLGYHSYSIEVLTLCHNLGKGPWQMGSLTGAVAYQRVTVALKGNLRLVGNHSLSLNAEECLTVREITRAGMKVGVSDPVVQNGMAVA
jgi:hypothetical protein